jgi:NADH-quinone oxidoreductase subunit N
MTALVINELFYLIPEMIFVLAGVMLLFIKKYKDFSFFIFTGAVLAGIFLNLMMFNVNRDIIFSTLEVSDLSTLLRIIILVGTLIFVISTKEFASELDYTNMYYAFLSFATVGMIILPSAKDLLTIFIAFELTSISTYALPFIDQKSENRFEAGIKYFLTGAFSSGLILFGMSYVFGMTGTLNISEIAVNIAPYQGTPVIYLAFILMFAGFHIKWLLHHSICGHQILIRVHQVL